MPVLSSLNWRKLPQRVVTGSSVNLILNNIYDMLTGSFYFDNSPRVMGSGSAWKNVGRFITGSGTGSNTEAVYCYPPTQSIMSQSVIICGINNVGAATIFSNVLIASSSTFINAQDFGMACVKNAGTFSNWTGSAPFGSGSNSTGIACFYNGNNNGAITPKITIYESQEAIAVFFNDNVLATKTYGGIAGAIIDPEQISTSVDAEADNRLYGVTTTPNGNTVAVNGNDGIQQYFHFLDAVNSTARPYSLYYHVNNTSGLALVFYAQAPNTRRFNWARPAFQIVLSNTASSKFIKFPLPCYDSGGSSDPAVFLGTIRGVYVYSGAFASNQVLRDVSNTNIYGFTLGRAETSATGSAFLLPY
jgi:hypothetical protein